MLLGAAAAENTLKGDVNRDGVVNIIDAGIVQQYLADYTDVKERFESGEYDLEAAKVTGSSVSVGDVTAIQRIAAELDPKTHYTLDNIRDYVVGVDELVELSDVTKRKLINFDNAATTPVLTPVMDEVNQKMLMYGSIGRGFSQKSDYTTAIYNSVRNKILNFLNLESVPEDDKGPYTVFYCNNTTDGLNKLASALIESEDDVVMTTRMEHHANDLSWRERCKVEYAEVDEQGRIIYDDLERALREYNGEIKYVSGIIDNRLKSRGKTMKKHGIFSFGKAHKTQNGRFETAPFNPETHYAVIRSSICTGEKVAGFKDKRDGHFTEVMLIRSVRDEQEFKERYNVDSLRTEY